MTVPEFRILDALGYTGREQQEIAYDVELAKRVRSSLGYQQTRFALELRRLGLAIAGTVSHRHARTLHLEQREDAQRARRQELAQ